MKNHSAKTPTRTTLAAAFAALAMAFPSASAAEKSDADPKHQLPRPDGKAADTNKPVKVFILLGQSNMVGMGDVGAEEKQGTLEYVTKTENGRRAAMSATCRSCRKMRTWRC